MKLCLIVFLNISLAALASTTLVKRCDECRKKQYNGPKSAEVYSTIERVFQLAKSDYFTKNYDLNSLRLIYPSDLNSIATMKRCVLAVKLKGSSRMVALKIEYYSTSRSSTDSQTQKLSCGGSSGEIPSDRRLPTEHYLNTLMNNQPHFNRYYPKLSGLLATKTKEKLMIYVSDFKDGSMDLQAWANTHLDKYPKAEYEAKVKRFYRKIHAALIMLKDNRYIYTDFKPQNVLIDNEEVPFLIDLESVILDDSPRPCLATRFYSPPSLRHDSARTREQIDEIQNKILSWTFCFSAYESMCFSLKEKGTYESISSKLSSWHGQAFMSHFGCAKNRETSEDFKEFINKCLVKGLEKDSFFRLRNLKWLKKKVKIPSVSKLQIVS